MLTGKVLISTYDWFIGPDGLQYKAIWGTAKICSSEETLGLKNNKNSTNWYVQIGDKKRGAIIGGCQVNYAIACPNPPNTNKVVAEVSGTYSEVQTKIYLAEEIDE